MKVVLVAEDDPMDRRLLELAAKVSGGLALQFVRDGAEVIAYLKGERDYANRGLFPLPEILVLDLHMPPMGGLDVIQWLTGSEEFKRLKVFLLSGSEMPAALAEIKARGVSVTPKPTEPRLLVEF